jgi:hypothetical protein
MASRGKRLAESPTKSRSARMPTGTSIQRAQYVLCAIWGIGALLGLGTLVAQTAAGTYGSDAKEAWTLISPLYVSTLSLLLGAIASGAKVQDDVLEEKQVRTGYFKICLVVSGLANAAYLASLWMQPMMIAAGGASSHIDALKLSLLWLLVIQGLVSIAIGGLFGSIQAARK